MDLQTAKLVAFAIYTEHEAGIMGVAPSYLGRMWTLIDRCGTIEDVEASIPIDLHWKLDNYWSIWSADLEESAPDPLDVSFEITDEGVAALGEAEGPAKARPITLTEKGEAAAQAAELELTAKAKAEQRADNRPGAAKRAPKKGR